MELYAAEIRCRKKPLRSKRNARAFWIADVRKKSDAAAFIIWYTRCEEHIEYIDILKYLY